MSGLPKGWVETTIADITTYVQRGKGPKYSADQNDFPVINQKAIRWFGIQAEHLKYVREDMWNSYTEERFIKPGDILWNSTGTGTIGRACLLNANEAAKAKVVDSHVTILRTNQAVEPRYLFNWIKSPKIQFDIESLSTGTTNQVELSKAKVLATIIPLAPLNEQIRIADKLDSILAKVDQAQARLEKIPHILKRYRQSVLAAATSGELTREWREGNDHQWPKVQLKDVGTGFNYGSSAKSKPEGDVPVLRMGNLQGGKLDWENLVFTSDEAEIQKYLLESGDVLFNRTNSPELVGKTSIYRGEQKAIYAGYLIRVKGCKRLNTEFLNIQLNSPHARDYCWEVKTDGVSQSNINAKKLQAYQFHLPEIDEQLEIVRRVGELFSHADIFERQYLDAKKIFNKLTSSILAKAFRGELVEQNPNDESASQLLERIKSQQLEAPKPTKKARSTKVKAAQKVEDVSSTEESVQLQSEVLSILQNANVELSAQQLMGRLTEQSFEAVDALFTELKRLLDAAVITKAGSGESCTFKAIKK